MLPTLDDTLHELAQSRYFTKADPSAVVIKSVDNLSYLVQPLQMATFAIWHLGVV